jgi:hypothetical protein
VSRVDAAIERLDFVLPDFTRLSWVSDPAREAWEPRLRSITKAWLEIEWLAILADVRRCGVTMVTPEELVARSGEWLTRGLSALPLEIQGLSGSHSYASTGRQALLGEPFVFRIVLGRPADLAEFKRVWDAGDNRGIGRLLGYPSCCLDFFHAVWVDRGLIDTTWPMALGTAGSKNGTHTIEVTGPPEANILWRWMGARTVPHLPCRFDCAETVALAKQFIEVGRSAGYDQQMDWLLEILSWPVEWSALHGIAEIKTPVLKVSTRTDATASKYVVRRQGEAYPADGAQGLAFPYRMPRRPLLTESRAFRRGLANPIPAGPSPSPCYASDNGFASVVAMEQAHGPILAVARSALSGRGGPILDLGCGNGALLQRIHGVNTAVVPFGIDTERDRVEHARVLLPGFADHFIAGDMFESDGIWPAGRRYALALLMPGRLLEAGPERAARLVGRLTEHCDQLLVYAYGDWLTRFGDLRGLAREAGLSLPSGPAATASLATFG